MVTFNYYRAMLMGLCQKYFTWLLTYGWNDRVAEILANKINQALNKSVVTTTDVKNYVSKAYAKFMERLPGNAYYDSRVPRTHRLVLRNKVFYGTSSAVSEFLKYIEEKYNTL